MLYTHCDDHRYRRWIHLVSRYREEGFMTDRVSLARTLEEMSMACFGLLTVEDLPPVGRRHHGHSRLWSTCMRRSSSHIHRNHGLNSIVAGFIRMRSLKQPTVTAPVDRIL